MGRPSKSRRLNIWMNGELVGQWLIDSRGHQSFAYNNDWCATSGSRPISLSMPLRPAEAPYTGNLVESYFDNLLPDSDTIRRRIRDRYHTDSTSAFNLLAEIGRDCVGAIQLLPEDEAPVRLDKTDLDVLSEEQVAAILRNTVTSQRMLGMEDDFRISIAGAQEKTALHYAQGHWHRPLGSTPTTHILKLPLGLVGGMQADMRESVENEWLCARIIKAFGLSVASCEIEQFEDQKVLAVERFDRRLSSQGDWWLRLPQEDMCQATGTPPGRKYEADGGPGIREIADLLLGAREAGKQRLLLFKANLLFFLLGAPDGHAKNFSVFLEPGGSYTLTPLYDVLSAYPVLGTGKNKIAPQKLKLAMAAHGKNKQYRWSMVMRRHWVATAAICGLDHEPAEVVIDELLDEIDTVLHQISEEIDPEFPEAVSDSFIEGIRNTGNRMRQAL
ncbi:MAG: type II toxin-antitoxin system HipA family toxin [Gammaproteobacteria bacterium]|nr:type II toxin-antitoxin system HipA family toxin [Gammaproteobacteria bacterium]